MTACTSSEGTFLAKRSRLRLTMQVHDWLSHCWHLTCSCLSRSQRACGTRSVVSMPCAHMTALPDAVLLATSLMAMTLVCGWTGRSTGEGRRCATTAASPAPVKGCTSCSKSSTVLVPARRCWLLMKEVIAATEGWSNTCNAQSSTQW